VAKVETLLGVDTLVATVQVAQLVTQVEAEAEALVSLVMETVHQVRLLETVAQVVVVAVALVPHTTQETILLVVLVALAHFIFITKETING
jgi:hypothetical protein